MNYFGHDSSAALETAHSDLARVARRVLVIKDHSILKGHRPQGEQNAAFNADPQLSKLPWPLGKHNAKPSRAIDVQTYPRPPLEADLRSEQFYLLGLYVGVASEMGIDLITGADWDDDGEVADNGWDDLFHVELAL